MTHQSPKRGTPTLEERAGGGDSPVFRSAGERRIASALERYGIRYTYEQGVLVTDKGKPKIWHPDFYLPEFATYIEYYGLAGNPDYDAGIERKTRVYGNMGIDVVPIYPWSFKDGWPNSLLDEIQTVAARRTEALYAKRYPYNRPLRSYSGDRPRPTT